MGKTTKTKQPEPVLTEVGKHEWVWVSDHKLQDLKDYVNVHLAQSRMNHTKAAERAGVSKSHWSNVVNGARITHTELKVIAKGLKMTVPALLEAVELHDSKK